MNSFESRRKQNSVSAEDAKVDIKNRIIRALARREHSCYELKIKLMVRDFDPESVALVLNEMEAQGVVSDERFAEAYCYHRKSRGFGPVRVASELKERQVSDLLIDKYVDVADQGWFDSAVAQRKKKFGANKVSDFAEKAKQMRFLQQKGFTHDQISLAINSVD